MKTLVLISTLFGVGLVGCGGSSSESSSVKILPNKIAIDEKNQIRITSDGVSPMNGTSEKVDSSIKLGSQDSQVKFFAEANAPISIVEIYPVNDNAKLPSGWIHLDTIAQQANLTFLAANQSLKPFSISCESKECFANTSYKIVDNRETSQLAIKFNGANNKYHNMLPSNFSPENHFYNTTGLGSNTIYQLSASNALVSGELNYSIPNQWAVMQEKRFPVINIEGSFVFDGKSYTITDINNAYSSDSPVSRSISLVNQQGQKISLFIAQVNEATSIRAAGTYLTLNDGVQNYEGYYPLNQSIWTDSKQQAKFNFNQLTLKGFNGDIKVLTANLVIPYLYSQLTLNNQPLNFMLYDGKTQAFARNEKKGYKLFITGGYSLTIIHEQKGQLSVRYQADADTTYTCGSAEEACAGLSVDADQKTYQFNQVKVGSNTLNGSVFIPGVFE